MVFLYSLLYWPLQNCLIMLVFPTHPLPTTTTFTSPANHIKFSLNIVEDHWTWNRTFIAYMKPLCSYQSAQKIYSSIEASVRADYLRNVVVMSTYFQNLLPASSTSSLLQCAKEPPYLAHSTTWLGLGSSSTTISTLISEHLFTAGFTHYSLMESWRPQVRS